MSGGDRIRALIPQQGAMCLLDGVLRWTERDIACRAVSHLDPANPLRHDGRLGIICGCEYGMQAAALHGALCAGSVPQKAGYVAALRIGHVGAARLDDPALGVLTVEAERVMQDASGLIYAFRLCDESGRMLLEGRGTVKLPAARAAA